MRDKIGISDNDLDLVQISKLLSFDKCPRSNGTYLDRLVVNQKAIEACKGLGGAIGVVEGDMGDATADTTRAVRELNLLDLTDRLLEVLLYRGESVVSVKRRDLRNRTSSPRVDNRRRPVPSDHDMVSRGPRRPPKMP